MIFNNKLKIALFCVALSGVTVACKQERKVHVPVVSGATENDSKNETDKGQVKVATPEAKTLSAAEVQQKQFADTKAYLTAQLMGMVALDEECETKDELVKAGFGNRAVMQQEGTLRGLRIATKFFGKTIAKEADLSCRGAAVADVSQKMLSTYLGDDSKSMEKVEENFSKVETYIANIQPLANSIKHQMQFRDMHEQPIADVNELHNEVREAIEDLGQLVRRVDEIGLVCSGPYCATSNSDMRAYSIGLQERIKEYTQKLAEIESFESPESTLIIKAQLLEDLLERIKLEEKYGKRFVRRNSKSQHESVHKEVHGFKDSSGRPTHAATGMTHSESKSLVKAATGITYDASQNDKVKSSEIKVNYTEPNEGAR